MTALVLWLLLGGAFGALMGRFGQCASGTCPWLANGKRGAIYGALLGAGLYFVLGRGAAYQPPKHLKPVAEADFKAEVLQAGRPVVVDFFATWCGPCKVLAPRLDKLAGEFEGQIKFVSVDVDKSPSLAAEYRVQAIPTLLFFDRGGKLVNTVVGLPAGGELRRVVEVLGRGQ